jgi:hypothetical protein
MAQCEKLLLLADFSDYIDTIETVTRFDDSKLQECKAVICAAVYGTGNPDISGIGVRPNIWALEIIS